MTAEARQADWQRVRRWASRGALTGAVLAVLGTEAGFLFNPHIGPEPVWKLLGLAVGLMLGLAFAVPAAAAGAVVGGACGLIWTGDAPPEPGSSDAGQAESGQRSGLA